MEHKKKPTYGFPKSARLRNCFQFDRVFRRRCSAADQWIVVYACKAHHEDNSRTGPRLGLTVSRKCGNAVIRNRWKRALREAFRLVQHDLPPAIDFVVLPRPKAAPQVAQLQASLKQLGLRLQGKLSIATKPPPGLTVGGKKEKS